MKDVISIVLRSEVLLKLKDPRAIILCWPDYYTRLKYINEMRVRTTA